MKYLLDTNILSEPLKPQPVQHVLEKFEQHGAYLSTAAIVWHELWFGCMRLPESSRKKNIQIYLSTLQLEMTAILPYTESAAVWHGLERARLQQLGMTPSMTDGQIAAIAHENGLIVVTRNVRDFEMFSQVQVENWFAK